MYPLTFPETFAEKPAKFCRSFGNLASRQNRQILHFHNIDIHILGKEGSLEIAFDMHRNPPSSIQLIFF